MSLILYVLKWPIDVVTASRSHSWTDSIWGFTHFIETINNFSSSMNFKMLFRLMNAHWWFITWLWSCVAFLQLLTICEIWQQRPNPLFDWPVFRLLCRPFRLQIGLARPFHRNDVLRMMASWRQWRISRVAASAVYGAVPWNEIIDSGAAGQGTHGTFAFVCNCKLKKRRLSTSVACNRRQSIDLF